MSLLMCAIAQIALLLLVVAIWIQDRRIRHQEGKQLVERLVRLESSLALLLKQSDKESVDRFGRLKPGSIIAEEATVATPNHRSTGALRLVSPDKGNDRRVTTTLTHEDSSATLRSTDTPDRNQILRLATRGISIPEIASRLAVPQGEVELIVNLHREAEKARKGKTA